MTDQVTWLVSDGGVVWRDVGVRSSRGHVRRRGGDVIDGCRQGTALVKIVHYGLIRRCLVKELMNQKKDIIDHDFDRFIYLLNNCEEKK